MLTRKKNESMSYTTYKGNEYRFSENFIYNGKFVSGICTENIKKIDDSFVFRQKSNIYLKFLDQAELNELYSLITKMVIVCCRKKLPLIIENPYSTQHYLQRYWCLKPKVIDYDRRERGDYYEKPTQYWFVNCEPKQNLFRLFTYILGNS